MAQLSLARLNRASDGSEFAREIIPRVRVEYQVTRPLFVRVVGQYVSERQAALYSVDGFPLIVDGVPALATTGNTFGIEALISYSPVPGTIAFLGYAASMQTPDLIRVHRPADPAGRVLPETGVRLQTVEGGRGGGGAVAQGPFCHCEAAKWPKQSDEG